MWPILLVHAAYFTVFGTTAVISRRRGLRPTAAFFVALCVATAAMMLLSFAASEVAIWHGGETSSRVPGQYVLQSGTELIQVSEAVWYRVRFFERAFQTSLVLGFASFVFALIMAWRARQTDRRGC